MSSPEFFMKEALNVAKEGLEKGELPIGAVVVLDNEIIASAHTAERREGRLLVHAELIALEIADKRMDGSRRRDVQLFTTCEPCMMCMGAAMSFMLGEIFYGVEAPGDGAVALALQWERKEADLPAYQSPKVETGVLRDESIKLFRAYTELNPPSPMWDWANAMASL